MGSGKVSLLLIQKYNAFPLLGGGIVRLVLGKHVWVMGPSEDRFRIYKVKDHGETILWWAWTLYHTQFHFLYPSLLFRFADTLDMEVEEAEHVLRGLDHKVVEMSCPVL